jgi:hypothetical protein
MSATMSRSSSLNAPPVQSVSLRGKYPVNGDIDITTQNFSPRDLLVLDESTVMYVPDLSLKNKPAINMLRTNYRRKYGIGAFKMTPELANDTIQRFLSDKNGFSHVPPRREMSTIAKESTKAPPTESKVGKKRGRPEKYYPINEEIGGVENFEKSNLLVLSPEFVMYIPELAKKSNVAIKSLRAKYRERYDIQSRGMSPEEIEATIQQFLDPKHTGISFPPAVRKQRRESDRSHIDYTAASIQTMLLRKPEPGLELPARVVSFGRPDEIKMAAQVCMDRLDLYGVIYNLFNLHKTDYEILGLLIENDAMHKRLLANFDLHPGEDISSKELNDGLLMVRLREAIANARKSEKS